MLKNQVFSPQETVAELDRYIIGQNQAKRAVAIALRNRWRRQQIDPTLRAEISPKNILMIGPTGVGKTEIARRLAKISNAPFIKVEASKFTEVGYVGKDVESMIRDLMDIGVKLVKQDEKLRIQQQALENAQLQVLELLLEKHPVYIERENLKKAELAAQEEDDQEEDDQEEDEDEIIEVDEDDQEDSEDSEDSDDDAIQMKGKIEIDTNDPSSFQSAKDRLKSVLFEMIEKASEKQMQKRSKASSSHSNQNPKNSKKSSKVDQLDNFWSDDPKAHATVEKIEDDVQKALRSELLAQLLDGKLDDDEVSIKKKSNFSTSVQIIGSPGNLPIDDIFSHLKSAANQARKDKKVKVKDAIKQMVEDEADKLIDMDKVVELALDKVQNHGMIFLDEIDKIALSGGRGNKGGSPDISRGGVQRDLLPIVEGSVVNTKYGVVHTDHILFIAAGAFHETQVSDLIPELQGRFPIRVELDSLKEDDFYRILTETTHNLIKQYQALLATENVQLHCHESALRAIAKYAYLANSKLENIGARRLHTVLENLFEEISYEATLLNGQTIEIDDVLVQKKLGHLIEDEDLSRYIL